MITQDGYVTATCSADVTTRYLTGYFILHPSTGILAEFNTDYQRLQREGHTQSQYDMVTSPFDIWSGFSRSLFQCSTATNLLQRQIEVRVS